MRPTPADGLKSRHARSATPKAQDGTGHAKSWSGSANIWFLEEVRPLWDNRFERGHTATGVGEKDVQKQRTKQGPLRMRWRRVRGRQLRRCPKLPLALWDTYSGTESYRHMHTSRKVTWRSASPAHLARSMRRAWFACLLASSSATTKSSDRA